MSNFIKVIILNIVLLLQVNYIEAGSGCAKSCSSCKSCRGGEGSKNNESTKDDDSSKGKITVHDLKVIEEFNRMNAGISEEDNQQLLQVIKDNNKEVAEEINKNSSKDLTDNFKYGKPLVGLDNIGATCYMNATLQCFAHIKEFAEYFKYSERVADMVKNGKNNLTYSFKNLIDNLWPDEEKNPHTNAKKHYSPKEFKEKISIMNPLFEGIAANDAKDLVNFIIMTLHEELNRPEKGNIDYSKIILDQTNQQAMCNYYVKKFMSENRSIISDLFYGINYTATMCELCKKIIYNYQTYFFLVFPLEEVRKYVIDSCDKEYGKFVNDHDNAIRKIINCNMDANDSNSMRRYINKYPPKCYIPLSDFCKICAKENHSQTQFYNNQFVWDENQMCEWETYINNLSAKYNEFKSYQDELKKLHKEQEEYKSKLDSAFKGAGTVDIYDCFDYDRRVIRMSWDNVIFCKYCKNNSPALMSTKLFYGPKVLILLLNRGKGIQFNVKVNFSEKLDIKEYVDYKEGTVYDLIGVITHIGESGMSGHFIAYCKDPIKGKWYKYNDSIVEEVNNFKNDVIDFAMPYLLFYQKVEGK